MIKRTSIIFLVLFLCLSTKAFPDAGISDDYLIRFELPFGIGSNQTVLGKGSYVNALFSVESFVHKKEDIKVDIILPEGLKAIAPQEVIADSGEIQAEFTLRTENDIWYRLVQLYVQPDTLEGKYDISYQLTFGGKVYKKTVSCWIASQDYIKESIHLLRFSVPADKEGNPDLKRQENTFVIKEANSRLLNSFNIKKSAHDAELIAVELENTGKFPVTLSLDYVIYDKNTGRPIEWLANLRDEQGFDVPGIYTQIFLKPNQKDVTMLRIASQDISMMQGDYKQKLSIGVFAAEGAFITEERPLRVEELNTTIALSAILSVVISLLGIVGMLVFRSALFGGLTSREYILIGLYAAIAFSLVSIPTTIIYNIFHALLGPFSFLVTGIFSEMIFYLLLISLIVLLPRRGVILCFIFAKFLLGAVILGKITALSIIWYPMRAVMLEAALFISGLYEKDFLPLDVSGHRKKTRIPKSKMLWVAFVFGITDAFLAFISLNITMFFYRLFYAGWYIWAYVLISGFLYTFIVVPMGIHLGQRLKKVAVD
ncbi:MAG: hypothetical protein KAR05_01165 [Candidatus Omnitrophica bacterium]|nr:hypothetical protein [Candidatus Omnitrophota bacterium]